MSAERWTPEDNRALNNELPVSAEQGAVEVIREALVGAYPEINSAFREVHVDGMQALDRLAVALERAERERDNARAEETRLREREAVRVTEQSNENERLREALENISTGAWGARAHIADYDVRTYARAALAQSEESSDE